MDVRKLLNISQGNMQNLRVNGTLPFTKISRMIYYDAENIRRIKLQYPYREIQKKIRTFKEIQQMIFIILMA